MANFFLSLIINALALWAAASIVPGIRLSNNFFSVLFVAFIFGFFNSIIGPVLKFFSLPLTIITFGLMALLINTLMLSLTGALSSNFDIMNFSSAFWGSIIVSIISTILNWFFYGR